MLPRTRRLAKDAFEPLVKSGAFLRSEHFTIRFDKKGGEKPASGAVVAGLAVSKSAVKRNLVKRRVRACLETVISSLPAGVRVAIFVQKGSASLEFATIQSELDPMLQSIVSKTK